MRLSCVTVCLYMNNYRERIEAEFETVEKTLAALPTLPMEQLSDLELAGVAALLHNLYNAMENILKQALAANNIIVPQSATWHRQLIQEAVTHHVVPEQCADELKPYLAFRHFFVHGYSLDLEPSRLKPLVCNAPEVYQRLKNYISHNNPTD